ncbi:hypothetical protein GINT2_000238 [Glugoides intestinalis]
MFLPCNSYQLKDIKNDIFTTILDKNDEITHFVDVGGYHAFSSKNELYSLKKKKVKKIAGFKADISALSAHQGMFCAGTQNGEIQIYSEHRAAIRRFKDHQTEVRDIFINENGFIFSSSMDSDINVYNLIEDKLIRTIQLGRDSASRIFSVGDKLFAFAKDILLYSLADFSLLHTIEFKDTVNNVIQLSEESLLFTCKNKAYILDINTHSIVKESMLHTRLISGIQLYDGKIYSCSHDGLFKSFNMDLRAISAFSFNEKLVSFSIRDKKPFITSANGKVYSIEENEESNVKKALRPVHKKAAYEEEIEYETIKSCKRVCKETDMLLENFKYKEAFKKCLESNDLQQTFHILKFISDKRLLMKLIKDADTDFIGKTLQLCLEIIKIEEMTPLATELLIIITSLYYSEIIDNENLKELICNISTEVNEIVAFEEVFLKAMSFAESIAEK